MDCRKKANACEFPKKVRCNSCMWEGTENDLCLGKDDEELCPACVLAGHIMDLN